MGRKRVHADDAEKMKKYRARQKAKMEALKAVAETSPDLPAIREQMKAELKTSWEPELKQARIEAERKKGRETAKRADQNRELGRTAGICEAAAFFIGKERADIARYLLSHFMIDRDRAAAALEADKRTKSLTLESLEKYGAWNKPPHTIKQRYRLEGFE